MNLPLRKLRDTFTTLIETALEQGYSMEDIIQAFNMRICQTLVQRKDAAGVATLMTASDTNRTYLEGNGFKIARKLT